MPESHSDDLEIDVAAIPKRQFTTVRKGFDINEVRAYLRELAEVATGLQQRTAALQAQLTAAESRAVEAEKLDEHRLVEQLGSETARVLDAARAAANDIRQKSQDAAARLISEANDEAHKIRTAGETEVANKRAQMLAEVEALRVEAAGELDRRRAEGDQLVAGMRREAQVECDGLRRSGEQSRQQGVADADQLRAKARDESKRLVDEAQVVREHMLQDLARRRRTAREQIERLGAARDRLVSAYDVVRRTVEEATAELRVAVPEAKVAGDTAMRRVRAEPEETIAELETEVATARIAGLLEPLPPAETVEAFDEEAAGAFEDELTDLESELPEAEADTDSDTDSEGDDSEGDETEDEEHTPRHLAEDDEDDEPEDDEDEDAAAAESDPPFDWHHEVEVAQDLPDLGPLPVAPDIDELFARLRGQSEAETEGEVEAGTVAVLQDEADERHDDEDDEDDGEAAGETETDTGGTVVAFPVAVGNDEAEPLDPEDDEALDDDEDDSGDLDEDGEEYDAEIDEAVEAIVQRRNEAVDEVERSLSRLLKRALADEQNEVLDLLRRNKPASADELLPSVGAHTARYADAARDDLDLAAAYGAESVGGEPDGTAEALAAELGQTVVDPLRERIVRSFEETDGNLAEVTDRLRALYREWKGQRIGDAARHYVAAAYAQGAYGAVPNGTPLVWIVDRSSDPCPDADDNALAGRVCKGEAFPTGDHCPPAHLGCRCLVVPAAD